MAPPRVHFLANFYTQIYFIAISKLRPGVAIRGPESDPPAYMQKATLPHRFLGKGMAQPKFIALFIPSTFMVQLSHPPIFETFRDHTRIVLDAHGLRCVCLILANPMWDCGSEYLSPRPGHTLGVHYIVTTRAFGAGIHYTIFHIHMTTTAFRRCPGARSFSFRLSLETPSSDLLVVEITNQIRLGDSV